VSTVNVVMLMTTQVFVGMGTLIVTLLAVPSVSTVESPVYHLSDATASPIKAFRTLERD
jgi:hypothetical protein